MKISLKDLTIEEKLRLLCGKDFWHNEDCCGQIPCLHMTDASMGVRMPDESNDWNGKPSVAYPSLQMLANTWNIETVKKYAECVADDCLDAGADVILGPGINIKRDPLCGRNFEYFSEDPYLAGTMACEYVAAMQAEGVGACLKHFCVNNSEYNRLQQSSDVDDRTLREIYFKPFETALKAKPVSIMCSYNRVNGVYASEYKSGFDILRNEYGFKGLIISDWGAVRDRTASAKAGLDLEMPFHEDNYNKLVSDYKNGKISEAQIDACAERVLNFAYACEALKRNKKRKRSLEERIAFTQECAEEAIVLLKNDGVLPLKKGKNVSMCGWYARPCAYERKRPEIVCGGGSGKVNRITPMFDMLEILQREHGGKILYEPAFSDSGVDDSFMNPKAAVDNAAVSDINIVFAGTGANIESEGFDRQTMKLSDAQVKTILDTASVNENTVVVLFAGAPVDMSKWIDEVAAVVYVGFPGERGGEAIANVLTGKVNPSGKLSETFPLCFENTPAAQTYKNSSITVYEEGLNVGYRYYDTCGVPVLFPFGFGLSYSQFDYKDLNLKSNGNTLEVNFTIANLSDRDGKEISQIYVRALNSYVYRPNKELKGFAKTAVKVRGEEAVTVELDLESFKYWSVARREWTVEDGIYEIIVGASCNDVKAKTKIKIQNQKIFVL